MATAILSALTNKKVKRSVAMTGEVTLRGNVLKIGGLKEKSLAAYRLGIREIIIPKGNVKDLEEIPSEKIISGSVWKIKVSADGYSEENFSLLFDWYQDELFVSANLQPVNNQ
jgi:ATP-dependent Lon protease